MSISTDVRKYGETVLEQGKQALDEARKPWYAAVGAGDLAYDRIQKQLIQLPGELQSQLRRVRANAGELDTAQLREAVGRTAEQAREAYGTYAGQARERYESLAHRGELAVRRLRRSRQVRGAFGKAEELISETGRTVEQAEDKVTRPGPSKTAPSGTTARKAPAKRPATKA
ncbi:MAG: hypothetical protein ACJ73E_01090 [Mycobacteriales bacterium]